MTRPRLRFIDLWIGAALLAAASIAFVGPIDLAWGRLRLSSSTPWRALGAAALLAAARLLLPAAGRAWAQVRGPLARTLRRPVVWIPLLVVVAAVWPVRERLASARCAEDAERVRQTRRARLGLTTRPVLTTEEMTSGAAIPGLAGREPDRQPADAHAAGRTVEMACGLSPAASSSGLFRPAAPRTVRLTIGRSQATSARPAADPADRAASSPEGRRALASLELTPGAWATARASLPPETGPDDRIFIELDGGDGARALLFCSRPRLLPEPDAAKPNLLLISLDTLRADHLGAYGYRRPVSPAIDRLARGGTVFEKAFAQSSWTTPSHMSLFTSLFPGAHGVDSPSSNRQRRLPDDRRTLAESTSAAGYTTAAFTGSGSISAVFGFWRGFDLYDETDIDDPVRRGDDVAEIYAKASQWLEHHAERPFFLFLHTYEVHEPFTHETFLGEADPADPVAKLTALYDGDILAADGFVERVLALLDRLAIRERTIVVLLSDHGEELAPRYPGRRLGHGHTLYDDLLHVPLIVAAPGRVPAGLRVPEPVEIVDVMPSVLDLMDLPVPGGLQGRSFAGAFRGQTIEAREVFAEATNCGPERKTVRDGTMKYVRTYPRLEPPSHEIPVPIPEEELFDLVSDPDERRSLAVSDPGSAGRLRRRLDGIVAANLARRGATVEEDLDEESVERLKALGYIR